MNVKRYSVYLYMHLEKLLKGCITNDKSLVNYTKIGNPTLGIFGGKYFIPDDTTKAFYEQYKKHVFQEKKDAYFTEKQLEKGKILIDLDFRYDKSVKTKQHSQEHIEDLIEMILNGFSEMFQDIQEQNIVFYIFEKESVNECEDKTKDGIHIMVNILCDVSTKRILRDYMVSQLPDIWDDLPLTNSWDDVVDEGVIKASVNWQLYGSKKPGNDPYKLKCMYETKISKDQSLEIKSVDMAKIHFDTLFPQLCARDTKHCHISFALHESFHRQHAEYKKEANYQRASKGGMLRRKVQASCSSLDQLRSVEDITNMIQVLHEDPDTEYFIKETHDYTMTLSKDYWGSGSYNKWIRVGWALKNTHEKMLLTWILFCSQSPEFDFQHNEAIEYWNNFDTYNKEGFTNKSIMFWSKLSNYEEYIKIHRKTVDYYIYNSFRSNTEFDLALTLFHMFKCQYVCSGIQNNVWFEFMNNRWYSIDSGSTLRLKISTDMYTKYTAKLLDYQSTNQAKQNNLMVDNTPSNTNTVVSSGGSNEDDFGDYKKKVNEMLATCKLLKKTNTKNNVMKEAKDLFWDDDFLNKLDKDPYLLGCSNCIVDFRDKTHRKGKHDDYISKSTGIHYRPLEYYRKHNPEIIQEVEDFMCQLFPDQVHYDTDNENEVRRDSSLREYMYEHLASTLLGTNENQTFNIYNGSGANGKSKLVELMSEVLGDYKGTVPITLVTQKRNSIGGTSSEVYNLIGVRYAVMQEPSKGDRINEGIMKELTGGDPIQCRALFKDSITFVPQFSLAVCTNTLFDIQSNDDGTWRRLRKVDFHSKFTERPYEDPRFPKDEYPHQYQLDAKINERFKKWAPVFLSMLVEIAFRTQGKVRDVESVLSATQEYRQEQDVFLEFHNAYIQPCPSRSGFGLKQQDLMQKFKEWFGKFYAGQTVPNGKDVRKYFEKKYGKYPPNGWMNISYKLEFQNIDEFS